VSSSGVSRGIHHKYEHPLNPTRLYVSGWVESWCIDWKVITCLVVVCILDGESIFDCMMKMLLALAYPVCSMVVLYVALLSCDDHQFNWWEQMGEVPTVSKEMAIPLLSYLGWTLCLFSSWVSFRAMAHVLLYALLFYSQLLDFYLVFVGIMVCPICRGCVKDPRTTLHYYFVCRFFYFRLIIKWDVT